MGKRNKRKEKSILRDNPTDATEEKKRLEYYDILHAPYIQGFTDAHQTSYLPHKAKDPKNTAKVPQEHTNIGKI